MKSGVDIEQKVLVINTLARNKQLARVADIKRRLKLILSCLDVLLLKFQHFPKHIGYCRKRFWIL
eukprot:snap_masked-scaffold_11-processed-gene-3.26-mRNA-1 protein AED:1.00 eAED:1.00 QI:0/-1/0/0/-1/1/1/0/64